jgi:hypothetical protein
MWSIRNCPLVSFCKGKTSKFHPMVTCTFISHPQWALLTLIGLWSQGDIQQYSAETQYVYVLFYSITWPFFIVVLDGGIPSIYKSPYNISNISYLNSPPPPFSFNPLSPHSWNSFNRYHFCIFISVYTAFALYSPSCTLYPLPFPPCPRYQPLPFETCSVLLFSGHFCSR